MEFWALIPLAAIVMWGAQGIARALAVGIARRGQPDHGAVDEPLRAEVEALRQRVAELEERQDFTERVLTRGTHDAPEGGRGAS